MPVCFTRIDRSYETRNHHLLYYNMEDDMDYFLICTGKTDAGFNIINCIARNAQCPVLCVWDRSITPPPSIQYKFKKFGFGVILPIRKVDYKAKYDKFSLHITATTYDEQGSDITSDIIYIERLDGYSDYGRAFNAACYFDGDDVSGSKIEKDDFVFDLIHNLKDDVYIGFTGHSINLKAYYSERHKQWFNDTAVMLAQLYSEGKAI